MRGESLQNVEEKGMLNSMLLLELFEAGEREGNLVESPAGHMMLKKIIAHDANRDKDCRYIHKLEG